MVLTLIVSTILDSSAGTNVKYISLGSKEVSSGHFIHCWGDNWGCYEWEFPKMAKIYHVFAQ